jgi:hypothetical protein
VVVFRKFRQQLMTLPAVANKAADGNARDMIAADSEERCPAIASQGGKSNSGYNRQNSEYAPNRETALDAAAIDENVRVQGHASAFERLDQPAINLERL